MSALMSVARRSAGPDPAQAAKDLAAGRRVLDLGSQSLAALSASLDQRFVTALDLLAATAGRIIVCGMGKSGHVARKIAATLASTGTPSQFVHPAEASHGDLGMITGQDSVLALSNSGETAELGDVLSYVKRFGIRLVAIVGCEDSSLANAADVTLVLPATGEACPMGLAPTTSTTAMLALGDALGVALLERKGFTPAHFRLFHPGGRLGQRLLKVAEIMHAGDRLPVIGLDAGMGDALIEMTAKSFGCVAVLDDRGVLAGIVTDGDLRRHMNAGLLRQKVREIMTPGPKTIEPNAFAAEAVRKMNDGAITSLFVVEADKPVGIVHIHDCLRAGVA
jgi:arabinose-5-phosphate isomerase